MNQKIQIKLIIVAKYLKNEIFKISRAKSPKNNKKNTF